MSNRLHIQGEYPPDWPEISERARAEVGHRCIRCGHPYKAGEHGKGQWTPCDEQCMHHGPISYIYPDGRLKDIASTALGETMMGGALVRMVGNSPRSMEGVIVMAEWRILTTHHLDGCKSNCAWHNLLPLCQRCHLQVQGKVNPEIPYFLEHSPWFQPYVAGFYAKKYQGRDLTRAQVMAELETLLALERLA